VQVISNVVYQVHNANVDYSRRALRTFSAMYPQHIIDEVRNAADILEVISDYVKLRRSGAYWVGLSPFKPERTPSFTVTPSRQIYKCFSTGKGGNVFTFLMDVEGLSFTEAVRTVAKRFNVTLPDETVPEETAQSRHREGILHALRFAEAYFQEQLLTSDAAETARRYVTKRGLTIDAIRKFGLGYAPNSYSALLKAAQSNSINLDYLHDAGLVRKREESEDHFDYFRDRLMFPIYDVSSRVIGFGGRVLENASGPKYLNSPETAVYHKSQVLYGIQLAKNEFRKKDHAMLVEGYMDVIALQNNGILNAVATSGTALTPDQARIIHRYTKNLTLIYDADTAGQNAMVRGLPVCLKEGLTIKMLHLPDGEDPDSFVKLYGSEAFQAYASENARDFVGFLIEKAQQQGKWDDPTDRKAVVDQIVENLALVQDPVLRELLTDTLAQRTKVGTRTLQQQMAQASRKNLQQEQREARWEAERAPDRRAMSEPDLRLKMKKRPPNELALLRLMLEHGLKMVEFVGVNCNADYFSDPDLRQLFELMVSRFNENAHLTADELITMPPPFPSIAADVLMDPARPGDRSIRMMQESGQELPSAWKTAKGALKVLRKHYFERKVEEVEKLLQDVEKVPPGSEAYTRLREMELMIKRKLLELNSTPVDELFPDPPGVSDTITQHEEPDFRS
jgi:DNA primase